MVMQRWGSPLVHTAYVQEPVWARVWRSLAIIATGGTQCNVSVRSLFKPLVELENDPDVVAAIAEIEQARKRTEEIRKKTRLRRFKDTIKEWAALSSYAGINHMGEAKNWGTLLFWSIFVLLSLILFFYLLVITLSQYLSYRTTVDLKLPNAQGDFPAVTICNMNAYKKSAVTQDPTLRALVNGLRLSIYSGETNPIKFKMSAVRDPSLVKMICAKTWSKDNGSMDNHNR